MMQTALRELERLRETGAGFVVFRFFVRHSGALNTMQWFAQRTGVGSFLAFFVKMIVRRNGSTDKGSEGFLSAYRLEARLRSIRPMRL